MVAFKGLLILDIGYPSSLGFSFVIEIQTHARRIELEQTGPQPGWAQAGGRSPPTKFFAPLEKCVEHS